MVRSAQLHFQSLHNCLINLPLSIHGSLLERGVAPQSLVVQLTYPSVGNKKQLNKAYVGWTGMPSQVSSVGNQVRGGAPQGDRVEMDPQFAAMVGGLMEGMPVSIELLRDLPSAVSVSVTPVSADDWEILETNAEFVESHLLNQVRAVKEGMVVGCWVNGTTLVRFTVDAVTPAASPALLLTSDTELLVAPKTRHAPPPASSTKSHDLASTSADQSHRPTTAAEWDAVKKKLVRLLPLELNPLERHDDDGKLLQNGISEEDTAAMDEGTAYVSPGLYRQFRKLLPNLRCVLSHHTRPVPKPAPSEKKEEEGAATGSERAVLVEVKIREGRNVGVDHVWVGEKLRQDLGLVDGGESGGYELLKFSNPLSPAARKAKAEAVVPVVPTNGVVPVAGPSSPTRTPLAGVQDKLDAIRSHVTNVLAAKSIASSRVPASGIVVTGNAGAGKTSLVKQIAEELQSDPSTRTHTLYVDCAKFSDERWPVLKGKMKDWFDEACWHAPTLLVLDNLDRMLGAEVEHADSFPALHLAHTFLSLAMPALIARPIVILATAQSSASMHPLLSTTHLLGETVSLRGPNKAGRRDIVNALVTAKASSSNLLAPNLNCTTIAAQTEGYLPADLRDLVDRAIHQASIRSFTSSVPSAGLSLTLEDFNSAQIGFVPLSLRDVKLQKSEVQWADIGGLHETRRVLRETLEWPNKYGAIFAACPLRLRSGLLLYGFPGCGKTLLASAVAKECGLNFISVKGPEILNKYIGASEKSVRDLFERAQAAKPCILFFDEFDSIAPRRGHDSTGVTDRVVNQMLTQMDGAEGLDGVYVLAATSRPDLIDPALLRPGRLDKSLLCDMPSFTDRLEIMQASARKITLDPSVDLSIYAAETEGYSGADLQALVYNAHLDAIHDTLSATSEDKVVKEEGKELAYTTFGGNGEGEEKVLSRAEQAAVTKRLELIMNTLASNRSNKSSKALVATPTTRPITHVNEGHLKKSLKATRPSVPAEELVRLRKIYTEFVSGRSAGGLPSGEASDEVGGRSSLM